MAGRAYAKPMTKARQMPATAPKTSNAGSRTAPSPKANAMAQARSHGQRGAEMRSSMAKPNPKAPLGQGGRFAAVEAAAAKSGARNPAAVAAMAGRRKYGAAKMAQMSAKGRRAAK